MPKVSVCMIAYRHAAYIRQAIESVLAQDVNFEIEVVIGDDCSPDGTRQICEELAAIDGRVCVLAPQANLGVMLNTIRTLQACTGEYVALCEGDDYWTDPLKLRKQVEFLEKHGDYAGATHQAQVIVDDLPVRLFKEGVDSTLTTRDLLGGRLFHTASVMFRRPVVELFCEAPMVLACDRLINFCISFLGKIYYSNEIMCVYRLHGAGMSSNATFDQMKLDLNSIPYLMKLQPEFPKYRYLSYVYATMGLTKSARLDQMIRCLFLSFVYSFADFPNNLHSICKKGLPALRQIIGGV